MSAFLLPGIPFTVLTMFAMMKLWRKGVFSSKVVESGMSVFFKVSAGFSVLVYAAVILFITMMWGTLGWWSLIIGLQAYLILALFGFIFTGKIW